MDSFVFLAILITERPVNLAVPSGFQQVFSNLEFTLATGIITTEIHKLYAYRFVAVIRQRYTVAWEIGYMRSAVNAVLFMTPPPPPWKNNQPTKQTKTQEHPAPPPPPPQETKLKTIANNQKTNKTTTKNKRNKETKKINKQHNNNNNTDTHPKHTQTQQQKVGKSVNSVVFTIKTAALRN